MGLPIQANVTDAASPQKRDAQRDAPILSPGSNCWRIEPARRLAFLVDGEEYFRAVREALREAQSSIFILGWDIDSRQRLVPAGANDGWPEPLPIDRRLNPRRQCPYRK